MQSSNAAENYMLITLHDTFESEEITKSIREQSIKILQEEWPRCEELRRRSISRSCAMLPTCFALILKGPPYTTVGHCQISAVPGLDNCCILESVVIRKDLRGKGLGRILVSLTEDYMLHKLVPPRTRMALTAKPEQVEFYRRLNYKLCSPIAYASGVASCLIPPIFLEKLSCINSAKHAQSEKRVDTITRIDGVSWLDKMLSD